MRFLPLCLAALATIGTVRADVYMHNPRGSNNRLDEQSATRNNNNRVFDSQNNARGGYNVGDRTDQAATDNPAEAVLPPNDSLDPNNQNKAQYQMMFFEGSILPISWTNQHGCGGNEASDPQQLNCNIVMQYTCENKDTDPAMKVQALRDGTTTESIKDVNVDTFANNKQEQDSFITGDQLKNGYQEPAASYFECKKRSRNTGLFLADQKLKGKAAQYTRQNPDGSRSGLECPEERDYYPYWGPTIWRDIAYLTDHTEDCKTITAQSQNSHGKWKCVTDYINAAANNNALEAIDEKACTAAAGKWTEFKWNIPDPVCQQVGWSRVNHLGNGVDGHPLSYNWTLPTMAQLEGSNIDTSSGYAKCVLRLRYNISTDDYDPKTTDAKYNKKDGVISPVENNPTIDIGANLQGVKLAVNTAQFGRTFQDRSHVFYIKRRPAELAGRTIYNLNVQGKRGNIVQTYPAVEYDFAPSHLVINQNDLIHLQWTGSNTHNNGGNGGDGQTGDAGEGTGGTDRHNVVQIAQSVAKPGSNPAYLGDFSANYPLPLDIYTDNMWTRSKCMDANGKTIATSTDCALWATSSGKVRSVASITPTNNQAIDPLLNNSPASLIGGLVLDFKGQISAAEKEVTFSYMCTRNNNFSNRSQKGRITVRA